MRIKYKILFYYFLSGSVSVTILSILDVFGFGKHVYYAGGTVYACLQLVLDRATGEWRGK
jgi:hypothetical protein